MSALKPSKGPPRAISGDMKAYVPWVSLSCGDCDQRGVAMSEGVSVFRLGLGLRNGV